MNIVEISILLLAVINIYGLICIAVQFNEVGRKLDRNFNRLNELSEIDGTLKKKKGFVKDNG